MDSKRNINQINNIKISSICLKCMYKHAKINMFSHETARETVGLTPNKYTYICTCHTLYSVLFELVSTSAENIFKSFRVANLSESHYACTRLQYIHIFMSPRKKY